MRTPTDSLKHEFQAIDPQLVPRVFRTGEQQALRLLAALMLAAYAALQPGLLIHPAWLGVLIPCAYALLQALLALIEDRRGPRPGWSALVTLLDLTLLGIVICNDPTASAPTLLLAALFAGLAGLRLTPRGLVLTFLLGLAAIAGALAWRHFQLPELDPLALPPTAAATLLVIGLGLVMRQHANRLLDQALQTIADDPETGLGNRCTLYAAARLVWPLVYRQQMPVTLMYVVIEPTGLKKGRKPAPTLVSTLAREFAGVARGRLRGSDILVRYAPLEFVFVLLDCPSAQADAIALQIQERFHRWSQDEGMPATAHIGATWLPSQPIALDQLLTGMDEALQRARQHRLGVSGAVYADPEHGRSGARLS